MVTPIPLSTSCPGSLYESNRARCEASVSAVASPSRTQFPCQRLELRKLTASRGIYFAPRCEVVSRSLARDNSLDSRASPVSAIEQLKISAADRYTREKSSIVAIGISFHSAPIELREKLAIPEALLPQVIEDLCALNHIEEATVLSTCNRMEIYVVALSQQRGVKDVTEWMSKISGVPASEICQHRFLLYNEEAAKHLFEVSAGLDSLVLGEGQILAQVKHVVKAAQGVPGFGRKISGLFKHAITVGKRVRTETSIATGAVSVSSAAVELAMVKLSLSSFSGVEVLLVGAGKMGRLVIKHLVAKGCRKIVVVNRSEDKVTTIREELDHVEIIYRPLTEMLPSAAEADIIFTSTASETPLFLNENIAPLPCKERLFVDISVPRNVGPCVSRVGNARLFNVDDLKEVVSSNREDRVREILAAESIIMEECKEFEAWKNSLQTVPTIKKLRAYAERIRVEELEKFMSKIGDDLPKKYKDAICSLTVGIVNKLLHGPMQHLRCDGRESRSLDEILENMHVLNRMFGLETEMFELEQKIRAKVEKIQK